MISPPIIVNDVIIVGAGAAGLMAARVLARAGKSAMILEARDRIGGRIYPLSKDEFGYEAMGGAEFIHGPAPVTMGLVEEAGLATEHPTEWWSVHDGEPVRSHGVSIHKAQLEAKLKELKEDMTVVQFLDTYFPAPAHDDLREFMLGWVEGYDAGDPERSSAFSVRDEMILAESNIFGVSVDFLKSELVSWKAVDWDNDPYAQGAYSYPYPGTQEAMRELSTPESGKLFFAGEAIAYGEGQATVEGAFFSGKTAAEHVLAN